MHKTYIPEHFFYDCKYIKTESEWINSEYVENFIEKDFKGAVFNLGRRDVNYLIEQGFNNIRDSKKIYCYVDLELNGTIKFNNEDYIINTVRDYMQHDQLRIYYIERLKQ